MHAFVHVYINTCEASAQIQEVTVRMVRCHVRLLYPHTLPIEDKGGE